MDSDFFTDGYASSKELEKKKMLLEKLGHKEETE